MESGIEDKLDELGRVTSYELRITSYEIWMKLKLFNLSFCVQILLMPQQ